MNDTMLWMDVCVCVTTNRKWDVFTFSFVLIWEFGSEPKRKDEIYERDKI